MPEKYKLTYFNNRGVVEVTRLMFAVAGVPYEDIRIKQEDWPALKNKTPQGKLPFLEINGKIQVSQSKAIARHVAREYGFYGKDELETTRIDVIVDTLQDIRTAANAYNMGFEKDESKKDEMKAKAKETFPSYLGYLEKTAVDNSYIIGTCEVTLADLSFIAEVDTLLEHYPDALKDYPKLEALKKKILAHEKVAKWFEERPKTPF